jgi:hypothetical protein
MNEQLFTFPEFRTLPIYDESDQRTNTITTVTGAGEYTRIWECITIQEGEDCQRFPARATWSNSGRRCRKTGRGRLLQRACLSNQLRARSEPDVSSKSQERFVWVWH